MEGKSDFDMEEWGCRIFYCRVGYLSCEKGEGGIGTFYLSVVIFLNSGLLVGEIVWAVALKYYQGAIVEEHSAYGSDEGLH